MDNQTEAGKLTDMKVYVVNKSHQEFDLMGEVFKRRGGFGVLL